MWEEFEVSVFNCQIHITVLNYTVADKHMSKDIKDTLDNQYCTQKKYIGGEKIVFLHFPWQLITYQQFLKGWKILKVSSLFKFGIEHVKFWSGQKKKSQYVLYKIKVVGVNAHVISYQNSFAPSENFHQIVLLAVKPY